MYKPLPQDLTIKSSDIEGLGVFSSIFLRKEQYLGITHVFMGTQIVRTPLGGFINHSETPNCERRDNTEFGGCKALWISRNIEAGEELTLTYTMYDPTSPASSIG